MYSNRHSCRHTQTHVQFTHWHFHPLIDFYTFNFILPRFFRRRKNCTFTTSWVPHFIVKYTSYMCNCMRVCCSGMCIHSINNWTRKWEKLSKRRVDRIHIQILKWRTLTSEKSKCDPKAISDIVFVYVYTMHIRKWKEFDCCCCSERAYGGSTSPMF